MKKLPSIVEDYLADLRRIRASGGATGERSGYGPLANLLNEIGGGLKPKVFCVGELADQGAGHPDFGLYAAKQVQRGGQPKDDQLPEHGVVEVKSTQDDAWLTSGWAHFESAQIVMPSHARAVERAPAGSKRSTTGAAVNALGETTYDTYLNVNACCRNVPAKVWNSRPDGYQLLKKRLSYRDRKVLGRTPEVVQVPYFPETTRRTTGLLLLTKK